MTLKDNLVISRNSSHLASQLSSAIIDLAIASINLRGRFNIILTGGNSVIETYKKLQLSQSDWDNWHLYLSDERYLPEDDQDRNDLSIYSSWLQGCSFPKSNVHFMNTKFGLSRAASLYEKTLIDADYFDLALLSMGEDGHIASLFPNRSYDDEKKVIIERNSPKYPRERISINYRTLNSSRNIFKVISGMSKKKAFNKFINGSSLPINKIFNNAEKVFVTSDLMTD